MSKPTDKTHVVIKLFLAVVFVGVVVACVDLFIRLRHAKNATPHTENALPQKSIWTTVDISEPLVIGHLGIPLELQVSENTTVYAAYSPDDAPPISPSDNNTDVCVENYKAKPYDFSEIFSLIMLFKVERQQAAGADISVLLAGDDKAKCASFIRVLEETKRAEIPRIYFETIFRTTAMAVRYECEPSHICGCEEPGLIYTEWGRKTACDITVTITHENWILWENETVPLETFVTRAYEFSLKHGSENIQLTVLVDGESNYSSLRYILDQWRRLGVWRGMVGLRKAT